MLALLALSWALENPGLRAGVPDADVDAEAAWEVTDGDPSVIVAVIDTGVDIAHPALAASIAVNAAEIPGNGLDDDGNGHVDDVRGWDFADDDGDVLDSTFPHGTMVSGIVLSLAPGVQILPVKVFSSTGSDPSFEAVAAAGIQYALDRGARVLQIAWELSGPPGATLQAAFDEAETAGAIVVVAAGNDGVNLDASPRYPASLASVIAVAGTDRYDEPVENLGLFVTNYGESVEIAAPTEKVETALPGGGTTLFTGTSASAPYVSAAAALVLSIEPALSATDVRDALLAGADRLPSLAGRVASGRLNANNAVRIAIGANASPPVARAAEVSVAPADRVLVFDGSHTTSFYPVLSAEWSFGDGVVIASQNAERRFDTGGTWPATLEVVDTIGLRHVSRTFPSVAVREQILASGEQSAHPYAPGTQLVTQVGAPGASSLRLSFSRIETAGNDSLIVFDGERTGVWSFQGAATNVISAEIRGDSAFLYLRGFTGGVHGFTLESILARYPGVANHAPSLSVDGAVGIAVGETGTFTAQTTDSDGDPVTLEWRLISQPEDSTIDLTISAETVSLIPDARGTYAILVSARDPFGLETAAVTYAVTRDPDSSASCSIGPARSPPWLPALLLWVWGQTRHVWRRKRASARQSESLRATSSMPVPAHPPEGARTNCA